MKNMTEALNPEMKIFKASDGRLADGLYSTKSGYYWFIEDGIFHFSITVINPAIVIASGFPILEIHDLHPGKTRHFIRARHCIELFPAEAKQLKTVVARFGATP